jgi:hypothetical protein
MPVLKVQLPQTTYEQLLTVADRAWRPAVWHAEWLLRRAIQEEYNSDERPEEPAGVGSGEQDVS